MLDVLTNLLHTSYVERVLELVLDFCELTGNSVDCSEPSFNYAEVF